MDLGFFLDRSGNAVWLSATAPTQQQLTDFIAKRHAKIRSLTIPNDDVDTCSVLDFSRAGNMPKLKRLNLNCVRMNAISFSASHMPALETLQISNPMGPKSEQVILDFALPELKELQIDYCHLDDRSELGLSLTRCPKLETFMSHKMWFAHGPNYMVLPNCTSFTLVRSDCTAQIEILSAPKLKMVNIACCYDMYRFRIWDLNKRITEKDVKSLNHAAGRAPEVWKCFMDSLEQRPQQYDDSSSLPQCTVSHFNVDLEEDSIKEAEGTRVHLTTEQVLFG